MAHLLSHVHILCKSECEFAHTFLDQVICLCCDFKFFWHFSQVTEISVYNVSSIYLLSVRFEHFYSVYTVFCMCKFILRSQLLVLILWEVIWFVCNISLIF